MRGKLIVGPRNVKRIACYRHQDGESHVYARHGCAFCCRKGFGLGTFLPPYQWALRMRGFENAGCTEGAIGQSKHK